MTIYISHTKFNEFKNVKNWTSQFVIFISSHLACVREMQLTADFRNMNATVKTIPDVMFPQREHVIPLSIMRGRISNVISVVTTENFRSIMKSFKNVC